MANTIDSPVSTLGESFDVALLDSARVSVIPVAADTTVKHTLAGTTTLITIAVGLDASAAALTVVRGSSYDAAKAWPLMPGYFPFGVPGGSRDIHFNAAADTVVYVMEN
ncbi:hypothetical protein [Rhizobium sp. 1399]|uniref:hypothetical protein n=1 Tax=Rhizobium sp. 1399 TaxID=2817758 RepID=UPI00285B34EE|nr:hypothetical protein [Rhizobium sp. 1399]MDR6664025.1 hypothetical protein [Rhizobium sp. 1399]